MLGFHRWMPLVVAAGILAGCGPANGPETVAKNEEGMRPSPPAPLVLSPLESNTTQPEQVARQEGRDAPSAASSTSASEQPAGPAQPDRKLARHPEGRPVSEGNLIPNGSFTEWLADERMPAGWTHGGDVQAEDKLPSAVRCIPGRHFRGGVALEQTWRRSDALESIMRHFGVTVRGLEPNTKYRLTVNAQNNSGVAVTISPYALITEEDGKVKNLALGFVKIKAKGGLKQYSGEFTTGNVSAIRFTAACAREDSDAYPISVLWDEWLLTKAD